MRLYLSRAGTAGLLLATILMLASCTGTEGPETLNQAGAGFLRHMTEHHAQAVEMAELVDGRAAHDELRQLARTIAADQQREIETMQQMLGPAHAEPSPETMPGMMSEQAMAQLSTLSGEAFDLRFIELMTAHHQGAIDMSQQVLEEAENLRVIGLAEHIIQSQGAEIAQMAKWRQAWS